MATSPRNAILKYQGPGSRREYPNIALNTIHSGDMVYVDQTSFDIKALDSDAHAFYFVGISEDNQDTTQDAYPSQTDPTKMSVVRRGWAKMFTTNGETYNPGMRLFVGADAQTVTNVAGSNRVGAVADLPDASQKGLVGTGNPQTIVVEVEAAWTSNNV